MKLPSSLTESETTSPEDSGATSPGSDEAGEGIQPVRSFSPSEDGGDEFVLSPVAGHRPHEVASTSKELRVDSAEEKALAQAAWYETADEDTELALQPSSMPHATMPQPAETNRYLSSSDIGSSTTPNGLPITRHYPTLESMQRLYKVFGYVGVIGVFGYLAYRLMVTVLMGPEDEVLLNLVVFFEFALPIIFGTVVGVGTLFAASELIGLAIDVQSNTLHSARSAEAKKRKT